MGYWNKINVDLPLNYKTVVLNSRCTTEGNAREDSINIFL